MLGLRAERAPRAHEWRAARAGERVSLQPLQGRGVSADLRDATAKNPFARGSSVGEVSHTARCYTATDLAVFLKRTMKQGRDGVVKAQPDIVTALDALELM